MWDLFGERHLSQRAVLLLAVGCGAVVVALKYPDLGVALLVGVGVMTLLHLLMDQ
ncbi:hypothetical protein [Streptomyces atriruber]|uniref:hypothetical protein n=1 Tax=Streptomyces atriruber TaxID=545121 RepID=UPI000B160E86|nr:hypothetical protein [Streptomyces atriruber]